MTDGINQDHKADAARPILKDSEPLVMPATESASVLSSSELPNRRDIRLTNPMVIGEFDYVDGQLTVTRHVIADS